VGPVVLLLGVDPALDHAVAYRQRERHVGIPLAVDVRGDLAERELQVLLDPLLQGFGVGAQRVELDHLGAGRARDRWTTFAGDHGDLPSWFSVGDVRFCPNERPRGRRRYSPPRASFNGQVTSAGSWS